MSNDLAARLAAWARSKDAEQLVELGCDLADAGRHVHAEYCFRRAVALGEQWVMFNVGNELKAQGRLTEAVVAYRSATAAGEADAWLNLGQCLEDLGDQAGAMHAYREAVMAEDPNGALRWHTCFVSRVNTTKPSSGHGRRRRAATSKRSERQPAGRTTGPSTPRWKPSCDAGPDTIPPPERTWPRSCATRDGRKRR